MRGYLRDVLAEDMDLLYEWANDLAVRNNSFSTARITYEEHKEWFIHLLSRNDCKQYIYVYDNEPIGQVRITISGDKAEVGYSICAEKRGMGHGKNLLQLLYSRVRADIPNIKKLVAKVKPENIASQRAFLEVGYIKKYEAYEIKLEQEKKISDYCVRGGVLYLTNNENALELYEWIRERCAINLYSARLTLAQIKTIKPELVVSYNYKYIISNDVIEYMNGNIINLHASYLPWNRGSNPNLWSFIDNTPKGVTIHQINTGLDTGMIIYQKECIFNPKKETFVSTYQKLNNEMVQLFKDNWESIKKGKYRLYEQRGEGSYHRTSELQMLREKVPFEWSDNIAEFLARYETTYKM